MIILDYQNIMYRQNVFLRTIVNAQASMQGKGQNVLHKKIDLWCDGKNCPQWTGTNATTVMAARYRAKRLGWVWVNENGEMTDLCPRCAEKRRNNRK